MPPCLPPKTKRTLAPNIDITFYISETFDSVSMNILNFFWRGKVVATKFPCRKCTFCFSYVQNTVAPFFFFIWENEKCGEWKKGGKKDLLSLMNLPFLCSWHFPRSKEKRIAFVWAWRQRNRKEETESKEKSREKIPVLLIQSSFSTGIILLSASF